ncbi:MAG: TraR/DksA family transcriptional regulator [Acidimicrobiales bacterium]
MERHVGPVQRDPALTSPLSTAERAALATLLNHERTRLSAQLAGLVRSFEDLVARAEVEPADDEHDPDGTTAYERAQISSLAASARVHLAEIDRALGAIDDDTFGLCQGCNGPIGMARLEAVPGTTRCVSCASRG